MDYSSNIWYIQSSCSNIRCNKKGVVTLAETIHSLESERAEAVNSMETQNPDRPLYKILPSDAVFVAFVHVMAKPEFAGDLK